MAEVTQDTLKQLQTRVKTLQTSRDQIMRQQAMQEQKRDESYRNLRELGIENPESLTSKQMQALADAKKVELEERVSELETQISQGETLVTKFQQLQQEG